MSTEANGFRQRCHHLPVQDGNIVGVVAYSGDGELVFLNVSKDILAAGKPGQPLRNGEDDMVGTAFTGNIPDQVVALHRQAQQCDAGVLLSRIVDDFVKASL